MTITNITSGSVTVTATGPVGSADISGLSGPLSVHVRILSLSAAAGTPKVELTFEDSTNAFVNAVLVAEIPALSGSVDSRSEVHHQILRNRMSTGRFGTASALLRCNVVTLGGTAPSCTFDAWIES